MTQDNIKLFNDLKRKQIQLKILLETDAVKYKNNQLIKLKTKKAIIDNTIKNILLSLDIKTDNTFYVNDKIRNDLITIINDRINNKEQKQKEETKEIKTKENKEKQKETKDKEQDNKQTLLLNLLNKSIIYDKQISYTQYTNANIIKKTKRRRNKRRNI